MISVRKWSGRETRALRDALRMSVRDFAPYLGVGERTVSKWEAGSEQVHPRPEMQEALDTALQRASDEVKARFELILESGSAPAMQTNAPRAEQPGASEPPRSSGPLSLSGESWRPGNTEALAAFLADEHELTADTALRLSHEWRIIDPPQVAEIRAGRRVGERLAYVVSERADVLRRMDDFLGGGDMHDLVRQELRVTIDMVGGASYTEKTGRSLLAAVGELCQLAGWVASDAGLHALAECYYLGGLSAAHAARDEPLAANLLSSLSYQVANVGDPRRAVLLASSAYKGAEQAATPTARALLLERVAWASTRFGDARATTRTLDAVDDAYADSQPDDEPAWAYWLNRTEIDVMAGRCFTELKRPERAIELLSHAVDEYDDTHAREMALYLSWLAEAHIYAGNIEEAAAIATRALHLSARVTSARSASRLRLVRGLLAPYQGNTAVTGFADLATELLGETGTGR